jgi:hypothetical protein
VWMGQPTFLICDLIPACWTDVASDASGVTAAFDTIEMLIVCHDQWTRGFCRHNSLLLLNILI